MRGWKYELHALSVTAEGVEELNKLGLLGWEVVGIVEDSSRFSILGSLTGQGLIQDLSSIGPFKEHVFVGVRGSSQIQRVLVLMKMQFDVEAERLKERRRERSVKEQQVKSGYQCQQCGWKPKRSAKRPAVALAMHTQGHNR